MPRYALEDNTRMGYWWPLVKDIGVPKPATKIIPLTKEASMAFVYPCNVELKAIDELEKALETVRVEAKAFGFPVFMRTDLISGKHDWKNSCFVASENNINRCIVGLAEANSLAEVVPEAVVLQIGRAHV